MGTETKYTHRHLARFIIEAVTPLAIASGQSDIFSDALVIRDVNGLPYIPGSSLAGIVRSMLPEEEAKLRDTAYQKNLCILFLPIRCFFGCYTLLFVKTFIQYKKRGYLYKN